ncbi:MAG: metallophosphoesterase [Nitrososphaerota archaeon]|nr:metallophosphoesterase [Nitrososphaerota archaeon]
MKSRIFFVSDVHGSERCFRKFINAAKFYDAQILILGGDITGKALIPIVEGPDGNFRLSMHGEDKTVKKKDLPDYQVRLRNSGCYYFVTTDRELEDMSGRPDKVDAIFLEQMKAVLAGWIALAEERLKGTDVKCYISPGNDDKLEMDELLKDGEHVFNPENSVVSITPRNEMITLGYANPTPWHSPREVSEEKLEEMITALADKVTDRSGSIFNLHVPPQGTDLDRAPAVNSDLEYEKAGMGMLKMISAGSTAVRSAIERYQPLLGLHGHIHESRGFARLGRTVCINPGSDYGDGTLRGALIGLEDGALKEYMLTSG